jgi:putative Ca2+/H+ antiporter (TMEM165/GDT1 family)
MISYGIWQLFKSGDEEESEKSKVLSRSEKKSVLAGFLSTVGMLALLDLAGDATELLTIVFLAHFQDVILVFASTLFALIAATALETFLGTQLRRLLSPGRLKTFSVLVFVSIGLMIIITTLL